jgi:hypothetical protein
MLAATAFLHHLFGARPQSDDLTVFLSARLDEAGTDERSPYAIVAGAVAAQHQWDRLEASWASLLKRRGVAAFHSKEFNHRKGDFKGWGKLKCGNFIKAQNKIIKRNAVFSVAVAVEKDTHASVKREMRGIRYFKGDSDVGLCFRILSFLMCEKVSEYAQNAKVKFIVEDGPYSADVYKIYQDIVRWRDAKYRPTKYGGMFSGFASVPKGDLQSLEVADFLAGRSLADLNEGRFINAPRPGQISMLAHREFLLQWHQDMLAEREHRQQHGRRSKKKPSSGGESS